MDFAIAIPTAADSWKLAVRAEELGFTTAWFYDTQMVSADCFVAMGAAAIKTTRIRLGTGVLVPSNRIAAVTANAFATLNKLAPGRIDFGVGTGFTARRAMGLGAMKLADMAEYIRVVMGLLAEQTVETEIEGARRKIRLLNPELGLIDTSHPVALHVSAYGPRSRSLVAKLKAGWLNFVGGDDASEQAAVADMRRQWLAAGHAASELSAVAFAVGCVLGEGEPLDSPRAIAEAGPRAVVLLHRAADLALAGLPSTSTVPPALAEPVARYVELARGFEPKDAMYLNNHRGHMMLVKPEERPFVTAELIKATTVTGTETALIQRIGALGDAGYTQFAIQIVPGHEAAIEDWARIRRAFA